MNKLSALALGTALTLSMPFAAFAQDVDAGVDTGVDAGVEAGEDAGVDAGMDAGVDAGADTQTDDPMASGDAMAGTYTYGDLTTAVESSASADLTAIGADTEINVVTISSLSDEGEMTADSFSEARTEFEGEIETLRTNVDANADIVSALEAEGYTSDDVVGVWTEGDGSVTIYVDDAAMGAEGAMETDAMTSTETETDMMEGDTSTETEMDAEAEGEATTQ